MCFLTGRLVDKKNIYLYYEDSSQLESVTHMSPAAPLSKLIFDSHSIVTCDCLVQNALELLSEFSTTLIVVGEKGEPLGTFSERDGIKVVAQHQDVRQLKIDKYKNHHFVVASSTMACMEGYRRLRQQGAEFLVIVEPDGTCRGVVSRATLVANLFEGSDNFPNLPNNSCVSEQSTLLQEVKLVNRRLSESQRIANIGSWELNVDTGELWWSDEVYRIFGIDKEYFDASYDAFLKAIHPEDVDFVNKSYTDSLVNKQRYEITHRLLLPDGEIKYVEERCKSYFDEKGQPVSSIGTIRDVTSFYCAKERENLITEVFKSTQDGVVITKPDGTIVDVNPSFSKITGYGREEVIGSNPRMWRSNNNPVGFFEKLWDCLLKEGSWHGEVWNRRKDGSVFPELQTINSIYDQQGNLTHYVSVFTDISKFKQSQELLEFQSLHDSLTGLPNQVFINRAISERINKANKERASFSVVTFDIDKLSHINESVGRNIGDQLLKMFAQRLRKGTLTNEVLARVSGDEFLLLCEESHSKSENLLRIDKFFKLLDDHFLIEGKKFYLTVSAGIATYPQHGQDSLLLLSHSEAAMFNAKKEGYNTHCIYTESHTSNSLEKILLKNALHDALAKNEFYLMYQPQFDFTTGKVVGLEALLRWNHPELGNISPAKFIPIAESTGLIHPIGEWVLRRACRQALQWLEQGLEFGRVAVNVAGPQISKGELPKEVKLILDETGLPASYLELEVTEGFVMKKVDNSIQQLAELRNLGIWLSIDDFGTGHSSLSYLKQLPIHKLKVDKSFIDNVPDGQDDAAIVSSVIDLAHSLNLQVVAEGVENIKQIEFLKTKGCDEVQGYFYSRPLLVADLEKLLLSDSKERE